MAGYADHAWLAHRQIRDDEVSPSPSEVCYEGQKNELMLKNLKSIQGIFHYLIVSRIRIGTPEPRTLGDFLKLVFFCNFRWTSLYWELCGCCRQLHVSLDF